MGDFLFEAAIGVVLAFMVPHLIPPSFRGPQFSIWGIQGALGPLLVRTFGLGVIAIAVLSTSYINVGDGKFAQLFRQYGGASLSGGRIVAINGENGPQAAVLRPGFHLSPLINVLYAVNSEHRETTIPNGKVGVLTAKDGAPLRPGQAFADPFPPGRGLAMLDAETFIKGGGQRGPQLTVLPPGTYVLNDYLWNIEQRDAQDVNTGFVGAVKSNVWADVDFGTLKAAKPDNCDVIGAKDKNEGRLEAPIVPVGCVGVWKESLQPGKYYFNPDAFSIIPIDTRAQVWTYAGGYNRCDISLKVDSKGEITQERLCKDVPEDKRVNADRAVFVKMEGWDVPLELRVVAQVSPSEASCVVAGVGSLKEVEDRVLTPSIRAIVRDVAGGSYEITEAKIDVDGKAVLVDGKPQFVTVKRPTKVLDLINQRPLIEKEVERLIRPEAEKSCVTIREVRLGEPAIPPELLVAVRREQLATQLARAYIQEQLAQTQRVASEQSKATADQQPELVRAQIGVQTSAQRAMALKNEGQGERDKLELIALGQKSQMEVLGQGATVQLRQFELSLKTLSDFFTAHPEVLTAALTNANKFVPNTYVGGGGGMFDAIVGKFLAGSDSPPAASPRAAER